MCLFNITVIKSVIVYTKKNPTKYIQDISENAAFWETNYLKKKNSRLFSKSVFNYCTGKRAIIASFMKIQLTPGVPYLQIIKKMVMDVILNDYMGH